MAHLIRFLVSCVLLVALSAPADAARRRLPDIVEDALAFTLTDRAKAVQLLEGALSSADQERFRDVVAVHLGEQHRLLGDRQAAGDLFRGVAERASRGPDYESARLGLALLDVGSALSPRTITILEAVPERDAIDTQNADRSLLLAAWAGQNGDARAAAQHAKTALSYAEDDPLVYDRVKASLESLAAGPATADPVAMPGSEPAPAEGGRSLLDRADAALYANDRDGARKLAAKALAQAAPGSPEHRSAAYALRRIDAPAVGRTVAVLLPLADPKYGAVGRQLKDAFEAGYKEMNGSARLLFVESGSDAESGVAALERAVLEEGALLAVGPLLSPQTDAMVAAAEALRVPMVSLSQALEDLDGLAWTVQAMVTSGDQVDALLDRVMTKDGMDAFAVFAPENAYGANASKLFTERVEARGGRVTVSGTYDPASTSLLPAAKLLGRKDYSSRGSEFARLRRETADKGGDPARVVLPPLLDFDALFLPDNASRIPIACAALAYEEFPMGDFQPTKDSPRIPLLGLSGWNNPNLVTTGGPYTRGGIFVDAFSVPGDNARWTLGPEASAFVAQYRNDHGRTPSPLEAITADAGRLVAAAINVGADDRLAMREALWAANVPSSITGADRFDRETRRATRQLMLLSITEDHIVPVEAGQ
ncbi:MAG: branched-chain amino acid transport system substrate-binding protein [Myxococcota bacterium]|jgi:branched-chain amino acid transport system substrate-binding protein